MSTRNTSAPTPRAGARRWASLNEAAEYIRVHPKTLTRRFSDGSLIRYRVGRRVMVDLDELDELVVTSAGGLKTLAG